VPIIHVFAGLALLCRKNFYAKPIYTNLFLCIIFFRFVTLERNLSTLVKANQLPLLIKVVQRVDLDFHEGTVSLSEVIRAFHGYGPKSRNSKSRQAKIPKLKIPTNQNPDRSKSRQVKILTGTKSRQVKIPKIKNIKFGNHYDRVTIKFQFN
jgi:hypothetical protein